jgi:hypothetical protein
MKRSKTATAAERRLRAEMGVDPPADDTYVSVEVRERMRVGRTELRVAFERLPMRDRRQRADEFKRRLEALCLSPRAHRGAWDALRPTPVNGDHEFLAAFGGQTVNTRPDQERDMRT